MAKKYKPTVGDIVSTRGKLSKITEEFAHNGSLLFHAHYLDVTTGEPMKCPRESCKGEHTCPIHGANVRAHEMKKVSGLDIKVLRAYGIHCKPKEAK